MLKFYIAIVVTLFLVGCGPDKSPNVKSSMFQSVASQKATLVQSGKDKQSCIRCGMNLVKYYKTSHAAQHEGKNFQYCSLHCLEDNLGEGILLKNPKVVDVESLKFINVFEAHYVVGSKKRGTMTKVSKYAFLNKEMAQKFQSKYGGKIMGFEAALEITKKDFKY